jgi:hypothetical protein
MHWHFSWSLAGILVMAMLAVISLGSGSVAATEAGTANSDGTSKGGRDGSKAIYDPAHIFCGSVNCYEVLDIDRTATAKDVKKAYRRLSLTHHPDKNKDSNATEVFRLISRAYEVLDKNESRALFDYYLDHPKVTTAIKLSLCRLLLMALPSAGLLSSIWPTLLQSSAQVRCLDHSGCGIIFDIVVRTPCSVLQI